MVHLTAGRASRMDSDTALSAAEYDGLRPGRTTDSADGALLTAELRPAGEATTASSDPRGADGPVSVRPVFRTVSVWQLQRSPA